MSRNVIDQCIRDSLSAYFRDLDGEQPSNMYNMVLEAVERPLFRPQYFDRIVGWGGGDAINNLVKYCGPGLQLISFDPKASISMLGPEAFADDETIERVKLLTTENGQLRAELGADLRDAREFGPQSVHEREAVRDPAIEGRVDAREAGLGEPVRRLRMGGGAQQGAADRERADHAVPHDAGLAAESCRHDGQAEVPAFLRSGVPDVEPGIVLDLDPARFQGGEPQAHFRVEAQGCAESFSWTKRAR